MKEYSVEFIERIERTPNAVSYRFKKPDSFSFLAGQFSLVNLGGKLVHPLSLSSSPEDSEFIEFTKRMTESSYCMKLKSLVKGETIMVKGPLGKFMPSESTNNLVLIAGGIGITPIRSILATFEKRKNNTAKIVLIYGNLNIDDISFKDELENLTLSNYHLVHVLSDTNGVENAYQGFINADIISKEVSNIHNAQYLVSGPPVMVEAINKALTSIDVKEEQVLTDKFIGY